MHRSPIVVVALLAALATPPSPGQAGEADDVAQAEAAANAWLALADAGAYRASWQQASPLFRAAVDASRWDRELQAVRRPLGPLRSRTLRSATAAQSLPGAPDGAYVVLRYDSAFAEKAAAVETVTPHREPDGTWKVSGYFIR